MISASIRTADRRFDFMAIRQLKEAVLVRRLEATATVAVASSYGGSRDLEAFAVALADERIRFWRVGCFHGLGIPFDAFLQACG